MRFLAGSVLFLFSIFGNVFGQDCDRILDISSMPSLGQFSVECYNRDEGEVILKIIESIDSRDIDSALSNLKTAAKSESVRRENLIKVAYHVAKLAERESNFFVVEQLLKTVMMNVADNSEAYILALISSTNELLIEDEQIDELFRKIEKAIDDNDNPDTKISMIIALYSNLESLRSYALLKKHYDLISSVSRPELRINALAGLLYYLSSSKDDLRFEVKEVLDSTFKSVDYTLSNSRAYCMGLGTYYISIGEYEKSYNIVSRYFKDDLGLALTNETILNFIDTTSEYGHIHDFHFFAKAKLFLTRAGVDISTVEEAFAIYEATYRRSYLRRSELFWALDDDVDDGTDQPVYSNIIVISNYLNQQLEKEEYLRRSIAVFDEATGVSLSHWSSLRDKFGNKEYLDDLIFESTQAQEIAIKGLEGTDLRSQLIVTIGGLEQFLSIEREIKGNVPPASQRLQEMNFAEVAQSGYSAVAFYVNDKQFYQSLVTPDTIIIRDLASFRDRLKPLVPRMAGLVDQHNEKDTLAAVSASVYDILFRDLEPYLTEEVQIAGQGWLDEIPFNALRMDTVGEAKPRYFGVEHALGRQFSISTLQMINAQQRDAPKPWPLALAPDFGNQYAVSLALREGREEELEPLFYNQQELRSMREIGDGDYLHGNAANRENYWDKVADHSIVHLATHALADRKDGMSSRFFLMDGKEEAVSLRADELIRKTLSADLVCLSACETNQGGRHKVEGRIGLTKAFLAAGARTVVTSNWAVDDLSTSELMEDFYRAIKDGVPAHRALKISREAFLERHAGTQKAHPAYWAAFDAYGGTGPVRWEEKPPVWPWLAGGAAIVGLAAFGWYGRRAA